MPDHKYEYIDGAIHKLSKVADKFGRDSLWMTDLDSWLGVYNERYDTLYDSPEECYKSYLYELLQKREQLNLSIQELSIAYSKYKEENDVDGANSVVDESSFGRKFEN